MCTLRKRCVEFTTVRDCCTHLKPQSSHSNTGFHPKRLAHKSHLPHMPHPLPKKRSSGLHTECSCPATTALELAPSDDMPSVLFPDLTREKRCKRDETPFNSCVSGATLRMTDSALGESTGPFPLVS